MKSLNTSRQAEDKKFNDVNHENINEYYDKNTIKVKTYINDDGTHINEIDNGYNIEKSSIMFKRSKIIKRKRLNIKKLKEQFSHKLVIEHDKQDLTRSKELVKLESSDSGKGNYPATPATLENIRYVTLTRNNDSDFGFILDSEMPLVIRFVSPSNFFF